MCEDIMLEVAGCCLPHVEGTLAGYSRRAVRNEAYPALVPDEKGIVGGILYKDVPDAAWDRLDRFEGEMYLRLPVTIRLADETVSPAETYVVRPEFVDHLEKTEWDFDRFLQDGKNGFQKEYRGYHKLADR